MGCSWRSPRLWLLVVAAVGGACKSRGRALTADAGPAARVTSVVPPPSMAPVDVAPDPRPLARCPVEEGANIDKVLGAAARHYDAQAFEQALACAEQAARLAPRSVEAHHGRADALAGLGRWDEARRAFTLALAIDPDDPLTLAGAAELYINHLEPKRENSSIGLEYARRGSDHAGRRRGEIDLQGRLALLEAQALRDLDRADEALGRVEAALRFLPSDPRALFERAVVWFQLCRFERAKAAFTEVLRSSPDDAFAHHYLGLLLEREGRLSEAEGHLRQAQRIEPDTFFPPLSVTPDEFLAAVRGAVEELDVPTRALLEDVAIETADLPDVDDLLAVDPPFAPTILGLFRGTPLGQHLAPGDRRAIILYRRNLTRMARTRTELEQQVRVTLLHEIGHLVGQDEDELRARGLE